MVFEGDQISNDRKRKTGNVASFLILDLCILTLNSTGTRDDINELSGNDSLTGSKLEET